MIEIPYMKIEDLNEDELYQLKEDLFYYEDTYEILDDETVDILKEITKYKTPYDIPNELVYKAFADTQFVKDDFWCNRGDE